MITTKPQSSTVQFLHKFDHFHLWYSSELHYPMDFGGLRGCNREIDGLKRVNTSEEVRKIEIGALFLFSPGQSRKRVNEIH